MVDLFRILPAEQIVSDDPQWAATRGEKLDTEIPLIADPHTETEVTGALLAAAVADALGWPNEPNSSRVGPRAPSPVDVFQSWTRFSGTRWLPYEEEIGPGDYSDDTQLTLCVARSLLAGAEWLEHLRDVELPAWLSYERGGGRTVKASAKAWAGGNAPWDRSTKAHAKTADGYFRSGANGVAMRIFPHVVVSTTFDDIANACIRDGRLTHGHMRAFVGAVFHAYISWQALNWQGPVEYGELVDVVLNNDQQWSRFPMAFGDDQEWVNAFENAHKSSPDIAWTETCNEVVELLEICQAGLGEGALVDQREILGKLGCLDQVSRGSGTSCAVGSLFLASRYAATPLTAIREATSMVDADTDTLGSMVGTLMGAVHGSGFLGSLAREVQDAGYLASTGRALADPTREGQEARQRVVRSTTSSWSENLGETTGSGHVLLDGRQAELLSFQHLVSRGKSVNARRWTLRSDDGQIVYPVLARRVKVSDAPVFEESFPLEQTAEVRRLGLRLYTRNLNQARRFFERIVGLSPDEVADKSVTYLGNLTLAEVATDFNAGDGSVVVLEVRHLEAILDRLKEARISVRRLRNHSSVYRCIGPDGHILEFRPEGDPLE